MTESNYSVFQEELIPESISARKLVIAAAAGLSVGILLTAAAVYLFSPGSTPSCHPCEPSPANTTEISAITNATPTEKKLQKMKIFTIFIDKKMNWYGAWADCRRRGMDLASIESEKEQQKVSSLINALGVKEELYWLSGCDLGANGTWVWMSNGLNVTYNKWHRGENYQNPVYTVECNDGGQRHCMAIVSWLKNQWSNQCCSERFHYACEQRI